MRVTPRTSVPGSRWYLIGGLWAIEGSRMSVRMTVLLFLISSSVAGMVRTTRGAAIQESELPAVYAPPGRQTYKDYCAACHGSEGKGHGPVARSLRKAPPDLTTLAKRRSGSASRTCANTSNPFSETSGSHITNERCPRGTPEEVPSWVFADPAAALPVVRCNNVPLR